MVIKQDTDKNNALLWLSFSIVYDLFEIKAQTFSQIKNNKYIILIGQKVVRNFTEGL